MSPDDRRWLELRARHPGPADLDPLLADAMVALGARGVEERDGWLVAHYPEPDDPEAFVADALEALAGELGVDDIRLEHGWQDHRDWAESWKRGLEPRRITERLLVKPSWTEVVARGDELVLTLDPGMAFGTAEHGTTRGCLRLLDRVVGPGDRVLDVGAGSGILSIAAALFGAGSVVAVEGDELACEALAENVAANEVADRVKVVRLWADARSVADRGPVDGVVANIETGLLQPLYDGFVHALEPEGWLIVSGILDDEWEAVRADLVGLGFAPVADDADEGWRSGLFRLTRPSS